MQIRVSKIIMVFIVHLCPMASASTAYAEVLTLSAGLKLVKKTAGS